MALIDCWECSRKISSFAMACPGCGAPSVRPASVVEPADLDEVKIVGFGWTTVEKVISASGRRYREKCLAIEVMNGAKVRADVRLYVAMAGNGQGLKEHEFSLNSKIDPGMKDVLHYFAPKIDYWAKLRASKIDIAIDGQKYTRPLDIELGIVSPK